MAAWGADLTALVGGGGGGYDVLAELSPYVWYKADAGTSTTTDGVGVSQWDDQSGNGRHLVQATSGNRPLYKVSQFGSLPGIKLDGTDDFMRYVDGSAWITDPDVMILCVRKRVAFEAGAGMVTLGSGISSDFGSSHTIWMGAQIDATSENDWRGGSSYGTRTTPGNGTAFFDAIRFDGTNHKAWIDGTATSNAAISGGLGVKVVNLGNRSDDDGSVLAGSRYNGVFGEIIVGPAKDDATVAAARAYLNRWGTP